MKADWIRTKVSKSWKELTPELKKVSNWIVIILVVWFTSFLHERNFFTSMEMPHLDTLLRLKNRKVSKQIILVEISDEDYHDQNLFYGVSPIDRCRLVELIQAVKSYAPDVIGVDFDTTEWGQDCGPVNAAWNVTEDHESYKKLDHLFAAESKGTALVWAAVPTSNEAPLEINPALGGKFGILQGIPQFPLDPDGYVRHYRNRVEVSWKNHNSEKYYEDTFTRVVTDQYTLRNPINENKFFAKVRRWLRNITKSQEVIFNFYGDRYQFPIIEAGTFLRERTRGLGASSQNMPDSLHDVRQKILENKIVLIGGAYQEARDQYFTPLGLMNGLELNALAIQSELPEGAVSPLSQYLEILIDFCAAWFIVWLFVHFKPLGALLWTLCLVPISIFLSIALFRTGSYWFNIVPIGVGVVIHQLYELGRKCQELQDELDDMKGGTGAEFVSTLEAKHNSDTGKIKPAPRLPGVL